MDPRPAPSRLTIGEFCTMIAGLAVGFWLFAIGLDLQVVGPLQPQSMTAYGVWIGILGGLSIVGPPILIRERRRRRRRFGPGEILWFSHGMSAWLLWPPSVLQRITNDPRLQRGGPMSTYCFAYGTPLMALYVGSALIAGGWIRRKGRRRRRTGAHERFGLILGVAWACTGGYCLYLIYGSFK